MPCNISTFLKQFVYKWLIDCYCYFCLCCCTLMLYIYVCVDQRTCSRKNLEEDAYDFFRAPFGYSANFLFSSHQQLCPIGLCYHARQIILIILHVYCNNSLGHHYGDNFDHHKNKWHWTCSRTARIWLHQQKYANQRKSQNVNVTNYVLHFDVNLGSRCNSQLVHFPDNLKYWF